MAYMGDGDTSTVYVAELQGVKLALLIAAEDAERGNRRNKVIIYTDNQAKHEEEQATDTLENPHAKF